MRAAIPALLALLGALAGLLQHGCTVTASRRAALSNLPPRSAGPATVCPMVVGMGRAPTRGALFTGHGVTNDISAISGFLVAVHGQLILVDGGLVPVAQMPWWLQVFGQHPSYDVPPSASAVAQLRGVGIEPTDVTMLIATHAHGDHAGMAEDFPGVPLVLSAEEAAWVDNMLPPARDVYTWRTSTAWDALRARIKTVHWSGTLPDTDLGTFDLFGDGSLVFVHTPGHTPGSMSVILQTGDGTRTFLLGDAALAEKSVRLNSPTGPLGKFVDNNIVQSERTLAKLHRVVGDDPSWQLRTAHDQLLLSRRHRFRDCVQAMRQAGLIRTRRSVAAGP